MSTDFEEGVRYLKYRIAETEKRTRDLEIGLSNVIQTLFIVGGAVDGGGGGGAPPPDYDPPHATITLVDSQYGTFLVPFGSGQWALTTTLSYTAAGSCASKTGVSVTYQLVPGVGAGNYTLTTKYNVISGANKCPNTGSSVPLSVFWTQGTHSPTQLNYTLSGGQSQLFWASGTTITIHS